MDTRSYLTGFTNGGPGQHLHGREVSQASEDTGDTESGTFLHHLY